jgi:hypothetical protein
MKTQLNRKNKCSYTDKEGNNINTCKDKPVITYCKNCDCVYAVNQDTGDRRELCLTLKELLEFVKQKEDTAGEFEE